MSDTSQPDSSSAQDGPSDAELFEAAIRGDATPAQIATLQQKLGNSPTAIEAYLDQIQIHALLEWRNGRVTFEAPRNESAVPLQPEARAIRIRQFWRRPTIWAAAASILILALVAVQIAKLANSGGTSSPDPSPVLAEVTELRDVVWSNRQSPLTAGTKIGTGELAIQSGTLRMHSRGDADVAIAGPARIRWIAANRVAILSGRVTTHVGPNGKGFVVEAPGGEIVDLGTEFGVQVGSAGETAVVVFEGAVELTPRPSSAPSSRPASPAQTTRLLRGQAVRIQPDGDLARVAAVNRQPNSADWSLENIAGNDPGIVIASVRDNIRDPAGAKFYQIVHHGLAEDVRAYVDRPHEWNGVDAAGIPAELLGADLLMTFNDDKRAYNLELSLTLARPAAVYVFFKPRAQEVPDWLRRDFVDTGLTIGMDEGPPDLPNSSLGKGPGKSIDRVFHVWRRDVTAPGTITLGPNLPENNSMYAVAAVALPAKH